MVQTPSGSPTLTRDRAVRPRTLIAFGVLAALLIAGIGGLVELWRFGPTDEAAASRLEGSVGAAVRIMTARVEDGAHRIAADPRVPLALSGAGEPDEAARTLFDVLAAYRARSGDADALAATIYDASGRARAWSGRPSDLPAERTRTQDALFVTPSAQGLRVAFLQQLRTSPSARPLGAIVVEHLLTPAPAASLFPTVGTFSLPLQSGTPISLRPHVGAASGATFVVLAPDGAPLLDGTVSIGDIAAARIRLRRRVAATALGAIAVTLLLLTGPLLDRRARERSAAAECRLTIAASILILAAAALAWTAFVVIRAPSLRVPVLLILGGTTTTGLAAVWASVIGRWHLALRHRRTAPDAAVVRFVLVHAVAGGVLAVLFVVFERALGRMVDPAAVDLRHFSFHPWSLPRLATLYGILLGQAATMWTGVLVCVAALALWRAPRRWSRWRGAAAALWIAPTAMVGALAARRGWPVPAVAIVLGAISCAAAAGLAGRLTPWYRRATVASRILTFFLALLIPALLVYPSVHFFAERSTQQLIAGRYAVEAMRFPQTLQRRLKDTLAQIDALPELTALVERASLAPEGASRTDAAFDLWRRTALATDRLTSDVEIYGDTGVLLSRFALNFPEYTNPAPQRPAGCGRWDIFGEAQLVGAAQERNTLHAQRSVCAGGVPTATIVVHVVFDYRTLPFVNSPSAYLEAFAPSSPARVEGSPAGDLDFVVYGWGRTAIYNSGSDAWPLDDPTFARVYRSREPFWTVLLKQGAQYKVYFANDRQFIYAIGYRTSGPFEHLVRLAELTTLAAVGYVAILLVAAVFTRLARQRPPSGRALLREIRASFYRKLFLAFVLASIVPVLILAVVIRAYFASRLVADIQGEAARTAAVAQRVIEESDALLRSGAPAIGPFGDDAMVVISELISQDLNVFYGPELFATSERDLYASGLLSTRTPDEVYRAIVLERLPSVVTQDQIGSVQYLLAAAPVRSAGRDAVLTVPLAIRQQEVEREIDDLDRGLHLGALLFILLGAGIGLSMAERIADPIRQLTRATGRIARGDFDARIAVRSSDELRRLVEAFNSMAAELTTQREQLERTHRLEAWAEMARQVAHEIKNPLTPIQLSAEHLRRVHLDRGEPLGPVLDGCVTSILGQVHLLRQIASEFSSFASSPTARRAPADVVQLVHAVVEPYRAGLEGRILIENDVRGPLPPVLVDRTLVTRSLANVVENALHAMPAAGRLTIAAVTRPGWVEVSVRDSGVGMDAEAQARIFEPYFSTKATGTGLGMPIARRNIELSGGTIVVESEPGHGTTVTISLPIAESQPPLTAAV